jgi:hypothetical protein
MKTSNSNNVLNKLKSMLSMKTASPALTQNNTSSNTRKIRESFEFVDFSQENTEYQIDQVMNDHENDSSERMSIDHSNFNVSVHDLPIEIICKIFDYLDYSQSKSASMVCKKWRHAHLESLLMKSVILKANNNLFISCRPVSASTSSKTNSSQHRSASSMALQTYTSTFNFNLFRNLVNLEFDNDSADIGLLMSNLKSAHSDTFMLPRLRSLKIVKTTLSAKSLIDLVNEAPKLRSLSIVQCDSLFMSGFLAYNTQTSPKLKLQSLEELSLSKNRYLSDFLLTFFLADSASALKTLDISYCYLTKSNFKSINSTLVNTVPNANSNVVFTIENLLKVAESLKSLKVIDLSGVDLFGHDEDALLNLTNRIANLEEIRLAHLPNLKVESVEKLFEQKNSTLKRIDLNDSVQVDDLRQRSIETSLVKLNQTPEGRTLSNIEVLKLNKAKINDPQVFIEQLAFMNRLTCLDLSCAMFQRSFNTLARLNQFIEQFAGCLAQCVQMETLNVSYCDVLVNDVFVQTVIKSLVKLKTLNLRNCTQITVSVSIKRS